MVKFDYSFEDNIAAVATPLSPAALSVIRTTGSNCISLVAKIFSRGKTLLETPGNTTLHGWILDGKKKIDEVIVCVYRAPKSFTGEDSVEIMCHGGIGVTLSIFKMLLKAGFREAEGGEFSFRAFMNGKMDLTEVEAVKEIIDSETQTAAELAANRLSGALFKQIEEIKDKLLTLIAAADVEIEYPEDETGGGSFFSAEVLAEIISNLEALIGAWAAEKIFKEGARIVIAGRTNAGKSSLFNSLIKQERAIVSDIHGTTRDWLEIGANFNGIPVSLYDTAGLRLTSDKIEAEGVERTKEIMKNADMILYLVDGNTELSKQDKDFLSSVKLPCIAVLTKADKEDCSYIREKTITGIKSIFNGKIAVISSKTGEGLENLGKTVFGILTANEGNTNVRKDTNPAALGTERQHAAAEEACGFLKHALCNAEFPADIILQDLEDAVRCLAEITGEFRSDDILDKVFSGFCVGK